MDRRRRRRPSHQRRRLPRYQSSCQHNHCHTPRLRRSLPPQPVSQYPMPLIYPVRLDVSR
jgi:hypothetical protein